MKTCSYCGQENDDKAATCAGCGKELSTPGSAEPVDPALTDPSANLVIVKWCRSVVDANMIKLRLEAAGIEACVPEELNPQIFWYAIPSPLEEVSVRVRVSDLQAARDVLADAGLETPPSPPPSP